MTDQNRPMRVRRVTALLVAVTALAVGAPAGASSPGGTSDEARGWDERVRPYVRVVEKTRGLRFDHPVEVRFLKDEAFEAELRSDEEPSKEDLELEEQLAGELRALGLAAGDFDLGDASEDLAATGTVGYYDDETEELVVRGTDVDDLDVKVTIVHELTHALQDQRFDLGKLYEDTEEGSEVFALDALVEGDATAVETAYVGSLSPEQQDEYYGTGADPGEGEELSLPEGVPYALDVFSAAPYVLGEAYVAALDQIGDGARNRAFRHPPRTEELIVDPIALDESQRAKKVPAPKLVDGEKKAYDPEQFGVFTLYLMLATRLDARTALAAVTGWGGDSYVGFAREGTPCVRVNVTGDTDDDTDELESALTAWAAAMPAGAVEVGRRADVVTFTACANDGVTEPTVERFDSAFYNVLGGRVYVVVGLELEGLDAEGALCVGDLVSTDPEVIAVFDLAVAEQREITDDEQAVIDGAYEESFPACGFVEADS